MDIDKERSSTVAVIGAGIIGITSALQLQQQGFKVTLIDAHGVAAGASFGNAGHIATEQVFPLASRSLLRQLPKLLWQGTLALRWRALWSERRFFWQFLSAMRTQKWQQSHQVLRHLCQHSLPAWQRLLSKYQLDHLLVAKGNLLVFEGRDAHENATAQWQQYQAAGVKCQLLTQVQTRLHCADLASSVQCSLWFEETGHCVSPGLLCQQLAAVFQRQGGHIEIAQVHSVTPTAAGQVDVVSGPMARSTRFHKVVICAGAQSTRLLKPLGIDLPLTAERGYHLMLAQSTTAAMSTLAIASYDRKMIMTPMCDGMRVCGIVEFAGQGAGENWQHLPRLLGHAQQLLSQEFNWTDLQPVQRWSGERPTIADSLPVIGESGAPGIWLNVGHQHLGLTFAAYSAELLLGSILGNTSVNMLYQLRRKRFD